MNYLKKFNTSKSKIIIGTVAIFLLLFLVFSQKPKSSKSTLSMGANMNEHNQQVVQFFTKVVGSQDRTRVFFPFSFKTGTFPLVLAFKLEDQSMREMMVYHPQISLLDWNIVTDGKITLHQKGSKYSSISEFLKSPSGTIAAENNLITKHPQLNADLIHFSNDNPLDVDKYDYILSTITFVSQRNATYYFEKIIDTSNADLDEYGQITWVIRSPDSDEDHVFYLGNIDVSFPIK